MPSLIVLASVLVFLLFGRLAFEQKSAEDFLIEIDRTHGERKWQAALGLASVLASEPDRVDRESLSSRIVAMLRKGERYDEKVQSYLVLALGHLRQPQAVEPLLELLTRPGPVTLRIHTIWALAQIGDRRASQAVQGAFQDQNDAMRKIAAYAAGELADREAREGLRKLLEDPKQDVAWNAALALAKLGDSSGVPWLDKLLDRAYLDSIPTLSPKDKESILVNALRAAALLKAESLRPRLEILKASDASLKVRQSAIEALQG